MRPKAFLMAHDLQESSIQGITELEGHPLAEFVEHFLQAMSHYTRLSPEGPDGGIDIIAHKDELRFGPPIINVRVKSGEGSLGDPVVSALHGKVATNEYGLLLNGRAKASNLAMETVAQEEAQRVTHRLLPRLFNPYAPDTACRSTIRLHRSTVSTPADTEADPCGTLGDINPVIGRNDSPAGCWPVTHRTLAGALA